MKQKYIITASLWIFLFMSLSVSSVYAWSPTRSASWEALFWQNATLTANDGDVVTTDKWNELVGLASYLSSGLIDSPRFKTPFLWFSVNSPSIWGVGNPLVSWLGLGYDGTPNHSPFIGFFDGRKAYYGWYSNTGADARPALGAIHFIPKDSWGDDSLSFLGFNGGLTIRPGSDNLNLQGGTYLVGWEKISLTSTDLFDVNCQYRYRTNHEVRWYYPSVVIEDALLNIQDSNWSDTTFTPRNFIIWKTDKINILDQNTGIIDHSHWYIIAMEKLCLPSYNPNGF